MGPEVSYGSCFAGSFLTFFISELGFFCFKVALQVACTYEAIRDCSHYSLPASLNIFFLFFPLRLLLFAKVRRISTNKHEQTQALKKQEKRRWRCTLHAKKDERSRHKNDDTLLTRRMVILRCNHKK